MTRYEYKLLHFRANMWTTSGLPGDLNMKFDELGAEGWEYVEMKPMLSGGLLVWIIGIFSSTKAFVAIFRRPRP